MELRNEKNIYTYFNYNRNLIECVYKITPMEIKEIFTKKWGPYLTGVLFSKLSDKEIDLFNQYSEWFEDKLSIAQKLSSEGYLLNEISEFLISGKLNEKRIIETSQNKESQKGNLCKIYTELSEVLKHYNITMETLDEIIETLPREQKISFVYYYGIEHRKYSLDKIASILSQNKIVLGCTEKNVKKYIGEVYKVIEGQRKIRHQRTHKKIVTSVKIYKGIEDVLGQFHITEDELNQFLACQTEEQEKCFRYVNGIGCPKMSISKTAQILNMDEETVRKCLNYVDEYLANHKKEVLVVPTIKSVVSSENRINDDIKMNLNNSTEIRKEQIAEGTKIKRGKVKTSLYEGIAEEDKKYVTQVVEYWKVKAPKTYNLIIKVYGKTYDKLNIAMYYSLTKEEKENLCKIKSNLVQMIKQRKKRELEASRPKTGLKASLYEGIAEEDKKYVTQVIEYWKVKTPKTYNLIVKVYGKTYDKLNIAVYYSLTKEEKENLVKIKMNLAQMIKQRKKKELEVSRPKTGLKTSLYEGVAEEDKKYATEVIEHWKFINLEYYNLIIKVYGKTYDKLNIAVYYSLTKEEKEKLIDIKSNLVQTIKKRKKKESENCKPRIGLKTSLYEGYAEEDKKHVTEVIEQWKVTNQKYYNLIVKVYGKTYDKLNIAVYYSLIKEEKKRLATIKIRLKQKVKSRKEKELEGKKKRKELQNSNDTIQNTIFAYCSLKNKEYAIQLIEYWKLTNKEYYNLIVKLYGPTYDNFDKTVRFNQQEQKIWDYISKNFDKLVDACKEQIQNRMPENNSKENADSNPISTPIEFKKRNITIRDIFASEIMEIGKYVYTQMQNPTIQKNAIAAWDRLDNLSTKPITDKKALQSMIDFIQKLQNSPLQMNPVDEDTIATRIKKFHF